MPNSVSVQLLDAEQVKALLQQLPQRVVKKGLRSAVTAGSTPILKGLRRAAPVGDSGLLKKSMNRKIKTYKTTVAAIMGASRSVSGVDAKGKKHVPANYLHLVVQGHGGPAPAPAHDFMTPVFDATKGNAKSIMADKLADTVISEARKLGNK